MDSRWGRGFAALGVALLVATLPACGGGESDAGAPPPEPPRTVLNAAKASVAMVIPGLSEEEVLGIGAVACRSLAKQESGAETRKAVREAVQNIGRDGLVEAVKDDRSADRVITAFLGPYCVRNASSSPSASPSP
jgi:hypothetical protein